MTAAKLDFTPAPGSASPRQMVLRHAGFVLAQLVRNGEQLLLTVVIPTMLLVLFSEVDVVDVGPGSRVAFLAPGILALAVLSTAFTAQAISTGFERRYGVLKQLGATPLPRWGLLAGKTLAVLAVEAGQLVLLGAVAAALGWRPAGAAWLTVVTLVVLATVAFSGLALLMAGTLRAEATLAAANLIYLLLLLGGGIVIPLSKFPSGARAVLQWLPSTALADGLRAALTTGEVRWASLGILAGWSVVAVSAAARWFRWE
jgi:ABC-2 type transport system permease protein